MTKIKMMRVAEWAALVFFLALAVCVAGWGSQRRHDEQQRHIDYSRKRIAKEEQRSAEERAWMSAMTEQMNNYDRQIARMTALIESHLAKHRAAGRRQDK